MFSYDYEAPSDDEALTISSEIMDCPWDLDKLLTIGVKAKPVVNHKQKYIVLLLDVSGSTILKQITINAEAFKLFVETLDGDDVVSIVTYASSNQLL